MSLSLAEETRTAAPAAAGWRRWLRLPGRLPLHTVFVQADGAWSHVPGQDTLRAHPAPVRWTEALAGSDVRLVLSGLLTHQLVVGDPALPLEDTESLLAWARHQFVHYHGAAAERWALAPWLTPTQRGASAAHGIDLDALQREAAAHGVRLRAVQPWWAVALQAAALQAPALLQEGPVELWIAEGVHVTRVVCAQRRIVQIEQHWLEHADAAGLAMLAAALAPRHPAWVLGYGLGGTDLPDGLHGLGAVDGACPAPCWLGR